MEKLVDYIQLNAERYPDKPAVVLGAFAAPVVVGSAAPVVVGSAAPVVVGGFPADSSASAVTYADLHRRIKQRAQEMTTAPQQIVCLRAECSIDFLVTYFALHRRGSVAAPLERDMPEETFRRIAAELGAHTCPEGTADVLYTTGTTGRSKGVMVSHETILADAENLVDGQGFCHDTVFVINGPLNHIGSLSKVYPVMLLGGTIILVDGLRDLNAFYAAFTSVDSWLPKSGNHNVQSPEKFATFLVPASIRILIQLSSKQLAALADRLDFIETGAAAISQNDMETLCQLLPHTRLYNTYASTETGIIATYNFNASAQVDPASKNAPERPCLAGCLGRPMRHSRLFITPEGLIACQGKTLMTGYVGDPERTASVLRDGTLFTSDLGRIDEQGFLHLQGREDDVINVGGFKVAPTEVEDAAMAFPDVQDCICLPVAHPITGTALRLLVQMADGATLNKRQLALYLKGRLETYKVPQRYEQVATIQRTFNGKLDRKAYKD